MAEAGGTSIHHVKTPDFLGLLASLELERRDWILVDHWEGDLCAIGVSARDRPDRLVYICTFNVPADAAFYTCDVRSESHPIGWETVEEATIDRVALVAAMERFLDAR